MKKKIEFIEQTIMVPFKIRIPIDISIRELGRIGWCLGVEFRFKKGKGKPKSKRMTKGRKRSKTER